MSVGGHDGKLQESSLFLHGFAFFVGNFCPPGPIRNPNADPDPADQNQCGSMRIQIYDIVIMYVYVRKISTGICGETLGLCLPHQRI